MLVHRAGLAREHRRLRGIDVGGQLLMSRVAAMLATVGLVLALSRDINARAMRGLGIVAGIGRRLAVVSLHELLLARLDAERAMLEAAVMTEDVFGLRLIQVRIHGLLRKDLVADLTGKLRVKHHSFRG